MNIFRYNLVKALLLASCLAFGSTLATATSVSYFPAGEEFVENNNLQVDDPFESFNRGMFAIHDGLDQILFRPVSELYATVVPELMRDSVHNALNNLNSPIIFINSVLQLNGERAAGAVARFLINSTVGFLGLFDVAGEMGIKHHDEDFGQTLAAAGVGGGPYLFLPIIGPSNFRDLTGMVADFFMDPFNHILRNNDREYLIYVRWGVSYLDQRTAVRNLTDNINKGLDPYAKYRSLYAQHRDFRIRNEVADTSKSPRPYKDR